ncbi:MAG: V-type ATP synthase subunit F [Methanoculleaceae archaeon]
MYRFIVVTDPDTAAGFRLAGVEVREAADAKSAREIISSLVYQDDTGIVAVNEEFMEALDEKLLNRIESTYRPVIIPIPTVSRDVTRRSYVERLMQRAIGYNIVVS